MSFGDEIPQNPTETEENLPSKNLFSAPIGEKIDRPLGPQPDKIKEEFAHFWDDKEVTDNVRVSSFVVPGKLFRADFIDDLAGNSLSYRRTYYRALETEDGFSFSPQARISFLPEDQINISKFDLAPDLLRSKDNFAESPKGSTIDLIGGHYLNFMYVFEDQTLEIDYEEGKLEGVYFSKVLPQGEVFDDDQQKKMHEGPVSDALISLSVSGFDDEGDPVLTNEEDSQEIGPLTDLDIDGRQLQVVNTQEAIKFVFYRRDEPDKVDYEVTIPKQQEQEDFELGTKTERRYVWEKDLIPEPLRRDPAETNLDFDELWKRADFARILGIKIEKNIAP